MCKISINLLVTKIPTGMFNGYDYYNGKINVLRYGLQQVD